jgi:DNA-binding GntR family transcriptional regulator
MPTTDLSALKIETGLRNRRITADYVADALRNAIQQGDLADNAVLSQAAIAQHFGVSRVPVREAMQHLQAEGLIEMPAHRLAVVRGLDLQRLVEVYNLRALLEGYAIELAVPRIDAASLKQARTLEREMREPIDHQQWLELNARFHRLLYEPSGATMTLELIDQLRGRAERYARLWGSGSGIHRPSEAGREHREILTLVAKGDAAGSRQAIERHIHHTRDQVVRLREAMGDPRVAG